jgi:hypothetical protein
VKKDAGADKSGFRKIKKAILIIKPTRCTDFSNLFLE